MIAYLPTRRCGLSGFVWAGTVGLDLRHGLTPLLERYLAEHAQALRTRLLPSALAVLQQHLDAGDRIVVATGAPPALARGILALSGHEHLPVLGTEVRPFLGGLRITRHCHFEEKMRILREAGHTGIDTAYSDSSADLPLLKAARNPVVVNPKLARIPLFQRILPPATPILNWGCPQRGGDAPDMLAHLEKLSSQPQPMSHSKTALPWLTLSVLVIALDQLSKYWVLISLPEHTPIPVIDGFWNWYRTYNTGAAFSFLASQSGWQTWFFTILGLGICIWMSLWLARTPRHEWRTALPFSLVIGGALGNLIDRQVHGHVIDFIQWYWREWYWPAFNLADCAIVLGAIGIIVFVRNRSLTKVG